MTEIFYPLKCRPWNLESVAGAYAPPPPQPPPSRRHWAAVRYCLYSTFIILGLTKGKGLYMASESLQSCISPFFAEFKESMTLNLAQRSLNVIYFGGNQKPVYDFI